jgi:hypothetical protein
MKKKIELYSWRARPLKTATPTLEYLTCDDITKISSANKMLYSTRAIKVNQSWINAKSKVVYRLRKVLVKIQDLLIIIVEVTIDWCDVRWKAMFLCCCFLFINPVDWLSYKWDFVSSFMTLLFYLSSHGCTVTVTSVTYEHTLRNIGFEPLWWNFRKSDFDFSDYFVWSKPDI